MLKKLKIKYLLAFLITAIATVLIAAVMSLSLEQLWLPAQAENRSPSHATKIAQNPATNLQTISLQNAGLQLQEVAQGIYALIASTDFPPAGPAIAICNGGFIIGSDSVLVIDPFQTSDLAELMIATVKSVTDKPIKYVLNTHYHLDHTGGNAAFVKQNIPVLGRGVIREYIQSGRNNTSGVIPPTVIINSQTDLWLGDRSVRIERVDGHSAGTDLVAYVPDAKVLFTGDMVFNQRIPFTSDADLRQWQGSLYRLIATYPDAKVVPGHGNVTDITGLQAQQAYFSELERLALAWKAQILSKEQVLEKFASLPDAYKNYKFKAFYTMNLQTAYDQFTRSATIPLIP